MSSPESELSVFARCAVLSEMLSTGRTVEDGGASRKISQEISPHFAEALYRVVRAERPRIVIEVGMACGFATLAMLTAMHELDSGRLYSIDPFQSSDWKGAGRLAVERSGTSGRHVTIEEPSHLALPQLIRDHVVADFAYIDGSHLFDFVFVDFFFVDQMLRPGGIVAFNDCSWPAIHKVLLYMAGNRRYEEVNVGLAATRAWESRRMRLLRPLGLSGLSGKQLALRPVAEDRYFRKVENSQRPQDEFVDF